MRAPVSWLAEYADVSANGREIAEALINAGLEVETVERSGGEVTGPVVVGRVLSYVDEPQKNGKVIRWCRVDVGEHNEGASEPDETGGSRGIVCGAHNFAEGDWVVVALPGSVLPGDFAIAARKTYGHISDGMICAEDELGLGSDHTGIIVLSDTGDLVAGQDALSLLGMGEEILDIAVTPDMGYCLSIRGLARETAQAYSAPFRDPVAVTTPAPVGDGYPVRLQTAGCALFCAVTVTGVDPAAPSPAWMANRLRACGMRSISLAVDVTNYVMLELGQPLHAYDRARLAGPIVVRQALPGERLTTLDDAERELDPEDIVITDDTGPIGIGGVMGGATTEISAETTDIVLEAAAFDPVLIARAARRHKLPSEASRRFERGVDPAAAYAAAHRAADLLVTWGGGQIEPAETVAGLVPTPPSTTIRASLPGELLGTEVLAETVVQILTTSGVTVAEHGETLVLTPPTWRPDLRDPYDYVEEVGRKFGLEKIEPVVPCAPGGRGLTQRQKARRALSAALPDAGFVEVLTFPFASRADLDSLGVDADDDRRNLVKLANPLADTSPYLRTTMLPGLFGAVSRNLSRGQDDLALYEIGTCFRGPVGEAPLPGVDHIPSADELAGIAAALPRQTTHVACVIAGDWQPAGWQGAAVRAGWQQALAFADVVARTLGVTLVRSADDHAPYHPGRCALLTAGGQIIGHAGELHPSVCEAFGLPARTAAAEVSFDRLLDVAPGAGSVATVSAWPVVKEDVALVVSHEVPARSVLEALVEGGGDLLESASLFDVYTGDQVGEHKKSLAFSLRFRASDRTLTDAEVAAVREAAVAEAATRCGAVQRM